jgi:hypothetical protein
VVGLILSFTATSQYSQGDISTLIDFIILYLTFFIAAVSLVSMKVQLFFLKGAQVREFCLLGFL